MGNGFPEGNVRIVNKATGQRLFAGDAGASLGSQVGNERGSGNTGMTYFSHTNDPVLGIGSYKGEGDDRWYFQSNQNAYGTPSNYLLSCYSTIRAKYALQVSDIIIVNTPVMPEDMTSKEKKAVQDHDDEAVEYRAWLQERAVGGDSIYLCNLVQDSMDARFELHSTVDCYRFEALCRQAGPEGTAAVIEKVLIKPRSTFRSTTRYKLTLNGATQIDVSRWRTDGGLVFQQDDDTKVLTLLDGVGVVLADRGIGNQEWTLEPAL